MGCVNSAEVQEAIKERAKSFRQKPAATLNGGGKQQDDDNISVQGVIEKKVSPKPAVTNNNNSSSSSKKDEDSKEKLKDNGGGGEERQLSVNNMTDEDLNASNNNSKKSSDGREDSGKDQPQLTEKKSMRKSRKPTEKSVRYEGDIAEDDKRGDEKTAIALKAKRRGDVFVEHIDTKDRYSLAVVPKNEEQQQLLEKSLADNVLFADLDDEELNLMVATMKSKKIEVGETVITQGEPGDNFYIVDSGRYEFIVDGKKVGDCSRGANFGELALLFNAPRAATVKCVDPGLLWVLPRVNFRKIVSSTVSRGRAETAKALKSVPLLSALSDQQIDSIVDVVTTVRFEPGDTVIQKGTVGQVFYFIKSGEVTCTKMSKDENATLKLKQGDYFGERALMTLEPRAANVIADTELELIALSKEDFESHLGPLMERLDRNLGARVIATLPMFAGLSETARFQMIEDFEEEKFKPGEYIVRQGEQGTKFYIIRSGKVEVSKRVGNTEERAFLANLGSGDFFGEGALLKEEPRGADVIAVEECRVFSLEKEEFDRSMNHVKEQLHSHYSMRADKTDDVIRAKKRQQYEGILMNELVIMKTLGTGTFGRVKLVHVPKLKKAFALKILQKQAVVNYKQQTNVISEKSIMEMADHPFILRLHKTFKDRDCLYMLLEFVQGGELFTLLHIRGGKLSDKDARFYAGCVQDGLEYLHDRDIVYRDLKPENLLIDDEGYIRIVDFGFSKKITTRSYTLCGTPEYLAPELVLNKGHNKAVDIWALGVLIFEMIAGFSPFADHVNADHMVICKKIVRNKVEFPRRFGEKVKDLVGKLLVREPHMRIGCLAGGHLDIKNHTWFNGLNFNDLVRKRIKAPWVPEIKDYLDTNAFEEFEEDDNIESYFDDSSWADAF